VKYRLFGTLHKSLTSVVFPTCSVRATTTTGKTDSAFENRGSSHLELFLFTALINIHYAMDVKQHHPRFATKRDGEF
jgi:hypothetical protein